MQFSPMSEDSDDARYSETPLNNFMAPSDSLPTSPSSPHRHQRPLNGASSTTTSSSYPSLSCNLTAVACCQPQPQPQPQTRQRAGSDSEGRFPSSPSDICHSADLRRAALLRSVQMRVQPSAPTTPYDLPSSPEQESMQNMEAEEEACSCRKSVGDECGCQNEQQIPNLFAEECSLMKVSESEVIGEKPCRALEMDVKGEVCEEGVERSRLRKHDLLSSKSKRSILGGNTKSHVESSE